MERGISVGATVERDAVETVSEAIVRIMNQPGDQKTVRHALSVLGAMADVRNVTVTGASVQGDRTVKIDIHADGEVRRTESPASSILHGIGTSTGI